MGPTTEAEGRWERTAPPISEDALMLAEASHRTANEITVAIAAMRLVRANGGASRSRWRLLDEAIERLEGFARVHRLLGTRPSSRVDAGAELTELCRALLAARFEASGSRCMLDLAETWVDGGTARRLALVATELVANAVRHALTGRKGVLKVMLCAGDGMVMLSVVDDGPGMARSRATSGTGQGGGIVAEIVARSRGSIVYDSGPDGTAVHVSLPMEADRDVGDHHV